MFKRMVSAMLAAFFAIGLASAAERNNQPILALNGVCPVCLIDANKEIKGDSKIASHYRGFEYRFPDADTKAIFDKAPDKYAIQHQGQCPVCIYKHEATRADPTIYSIFNKKLYIFANENYKRSFDREPTKYVKTDGSGRAMRSGS